MPVVKLLLAVNEEKIVAAPSAASGGYLWSCVEHSDNITISGPVFLSRQPDTSACGVYGDDRFTIKAIRSGPGVAVLECRRPWEKDKAPLRTLRCDVIVMP